MVGGEQTASDARARDDGRGGIAVGRLRHRDTAEHHRAVHGVVELVGLGTPLGVIVSITFGTVAGRPCSAGRCWRAAHTPNWKSCGVGWNPRAWSELNPSWPVSATVNAHPRAGVPPSAGLGHRERDVARDRRWR